MTACPLRRHWIALLVLAIGGGAMSADAEFPKLALRPVSLGQIHSPTAITPAPDGSGRLFICDQPGYVYILQGGALSSTPFLDLSATAVAQTTAPSEVGLLGLAFHPGFADPNSPGYRRFYVDYNKPWVAGVDPDPPVADHTPACVTVVAEFQVSDSDPNVADPTERRVLVFTQPQSTNKGGQLEFGPDGLLYISTGDGGGSGDNEAGHTGGGATKPANPLGNAQDRTNYLGKILRIDPLDPDDAGPMTYSVPPDNPFSNDPTPGVKAEIYAYGLRNPWRFSFDQRPGGTNRLFCGDVGEARIEEINLVVAGGNYGWRYLEGTEMPAFSSGASLNPMPNPGGPFIAPVVQYAHPNVTTTPPLPALGVAVVGGYVYRGPAIPALHGKYLFGDFGGVSGTSGRIMTSQEAPAGSGLFTPPASLSLVNGDVIAGKRLLTFGEDQAGEIYVGLKSTAGVLELGADGLPAGSIYKIVPQQRVVSTFSSAQDNTIFSDDADPAWVSARHYSDSSNALGYLYAGRTGPNRGPYVRRALAQFDIGARIAPDSKIVAATVAMNVSKAGSDALGRALELHRLTETWGEGSSRSTAGAGVVATTDDATWHYRFYNSAAWSSDGAAFIPVASALATVQTLGLVTWSSTPDLVADVQYWVDLPAENAGWLIRGDEAVDQTAVQIDSRQIGSIPPRLTVTYDTADPAVLIFRPADIVAEAVDATGAPVSFSVGGADRFGLGYSVTADRTSGDLFPIGTTTVHLSCDDGTGNVAISSFDIIVQDSTAPSVSVPGTITLEATGPGGAVATFQVSSSDAVSTPVVESTPSSGSTFPVGENHVMVTATDAAGNTATRTFLVNIVDTTAPTITGDFPDRTTSSATVPDFTSLPTTADIVGVTAVTQDPAPGSALAMGANVITLAAHDAAGNMASLTFVLTRYPADPAHTVKYLSGAPVPGAGDPGGPPPDSVFVRFGVPAINDAGALAFTAKWTSPSGHGSGVFVGNPAVLVVKEGDPVAGAPGATYRSFTDPVLDAEGHIAFFATITGDGVTAVNNRVLATNALTGSLEVAVRQDSTLAVAGAPRVKRMREVSLVGEEVLFTAALAGGTPPTNRGSGEGAFRLHSSGAPEWVVRQSFPFGSSTVKSFRLLDVTAGSPAQGRAHQPDAASFPIFLSDRTQALVTSTGGVLTPVCATGEKTGGSILPEATFETFGPPMVSGSHLAFRAKLSVGADATTADDEAEFLGVASHFDPIARENEPVADLPTAAFRSFADPLLAPDSTAAAFLATIRGSGVTKATRDIVCYRSAAGMLRTIARTGDHPPATADRVRWKRFESLALPGGDTGPLLQARLSGPGVSGANDRGVWAINTNGEMVQLFREGSDVGGLRLKRFTALEAVPGSTGTTRAFNNHALVAWRAEFAGGATGIVVTSVP